MLLILSLNFKNLEYLTKKLFSPVQLQGSDKNACLKKIQVSNYQRNKNYAKDDYTQIYAEGRLKT